ncbi:phosphatase PAP2 family protein [Patescibacteria group bacterium]|nr:phosphatase PAP2 family protein [Patescibacteria group bacterium]
MDYNFLKWFNSFAGQWEWLDILGLICAEYLIFAIPLIIILVYFFSKNKKKILSIILKIILALALVYALNYLIGLIFTRPRPFVNNNEIYQLAKLFTKPTDFSFPSYHTATAFVFAFMVLLDWKKFGIILLITALIIGFARIFAGVHYPTDILGGIFTALVSIVLINFILKYFKYGNT